MEVKARGGSSNAHHDYPLAAPPLPTTGQTPHTGQWMPTGSSNDHLHSTPSGVGTAGTRRRGFRTGAHPADGKDPFMLRLPFQNLQIPQNQVARINYPIFSPATGYSPKMRTESDDIKWLSDADMTAIQICIECDRNDGTRFCPKFRCLKNQGKQHREQGWVANICCNIGCKKTLCGHHLLPKDKGSAEMRLKFCDDCARKRAHCCQCGLFGIDKA